MTEPAEVTVLVSEHVFEYRRLSELVRRLYLEDTDEQIDIDEFGERMARRGLVIQKLIQLNQWPLVSALNAEDHLYWRQIVLRRKLQERGATFAEIQSNPEVLGLQQKLEQIDTRIVNLSHEAGQGRKGVKA